MPARSNATLEFMEAVDEAAALQAPKPTMKKITLNLDEADLAMVAELKRALDMPTTTAVIKRAIKIASVAADSAGNSRLLKIEKAGGGKAMMLL